MIWSWYTGLWWVGCYIWYSDEGTGRGLSPPRPLLAVPNVKAHPSTASISPCCCILVRCCTVLMCPFDHNAPESQRLRPASSTCHDQFWSSGLLRRRSRRLELSTSSPPLPVAEIWLFQAGSEDSPLHGVPVFFSYARSTSDTSALGALCNGAIKINIDIYINKVAWSSAIVEAARLSVS